MLSEFASVILQLDQETESKEEKTKQTRPERNIQCVFDKLIYIFQSVHYIKTGFDVL